MDWPQLMLVSKIFLMGVVVLLNLAPFFIQAAASIDKGDYWYVGAGKVLSFWIIIYSCLVVFAIGLDVCGKI